MRLYAGYSETMFDQRKLRETAKRLARVVPLLLLRHEATAIAVRGKSGIALAFAMSAVADADIPIIVSRKETEMSHGSMLEGTVDVDGLRYLVLDDFVSSGDTVRAIEDALGKHGATCVGVIEYASNWRTSPARVLPGLHDLPIYNVSAHTEAALLELA